ncbi:hypothetical protein I4F81_005526 [Pyropia yezoensis]|uniref:Uncharacterized protein n=1 Tax=Pyropia yezoensis TaxID=2788 RepID=A0ACC3BYL2_PYRYE|nr:hypothetical protein I4F81_005526 [Neopyropia yezoensis]
MTAWERFQSYCTGAWLRSLPAHYTTVAGYVSWLHTGGTVSADSMGSYLSPVDTVHELAGYPPPTAHQIFPRLRMGYLRLSTARAGSMPLYTAPLPADVIQQALALGTKNSTTEQRRLGASPPVGVRWSGKSLRSGAASAANAVGVPLAVVAAYMEHSQTAVTARSYIDARFLPTAAAWDFFGRYISDWSGIPGPVRKGG